MSTKTDIAQIRRGIQQNKLEPVQALNQATEAMNRLLLLLPADSTGAYVSDAMGLYHTLATGNTVQHKGYGHNKQWFDARIREIGTCLEGLEKAIKKESS